MIGTVIGAIVVGAVIGVLARFVMPGRQGIGMVVTIVLGVVGSFLGSWVTAQFGYQNANGGFALLPFIVGVIAAVVLIGLYVGIAGRGDRTAHR